MKKVFLALAIASLTFAYANPVKHDKGCTGSKNCTACKNCSGCQHCAKGGGTCGVCKK